MVLSLKANKKRIIAVIALLGIVVLGFSLVPKLTESPVTYQGGTEGERLSFLESFGYTLAKDPLDVRTVTVPKEFSDIYEEYNRMQKAQDFDLAPYKGKECKQYVYLITNYPGVKSEVHATMLVYQNIIIGGDVSSAELEGFMHGFSMDSEHFNKNALNSEKSQTEKTESKNDGTESKTDENEETINETESSAAQTTANQNEVSEDIYPTD